MRGRSETTDPIRLAALVDHVRSDLALPTSGPLQRIDIPLVDLAVRHGCSAVLERTAPTAGADESAATLLRATRRDRSLRSISARSLVPNVLGDLSQSGIDALAVKGVALAALTGRPSVDRPGNDIDLLVRTADVLAAHRTLTSTGWRLRDQSPEPGEDSRTRYVLWAQNEADYHRDGASIDLHWRLTPMRIPGLDTESLFRKSRTIDVDGTSLPTICAEHALVHAIAHAAKDDWRSLASVVDLHLLLERCDLTFDDAASHLPRSIALPDARAAVGFLRSGRPFPDHADRRASRWCRHVAAVHDDDRRKSAAESIAVRTRWLSIRPTPHTAALAVCNTVLPPAAFTWSRLPARWWPFVLPARVLHAIAPRRRRRSSNEVAVHAENTVRS